jgi:hypothetical protein
VNRLNWFFIGCAALCLAATEPQLRHGPSAKLHGLRGIVEQLRIQFRDQGCTIDQILVNPATNESQFFRFEGTAKDATAALTIAGTIDRSKDLVAGFIHGKEWDLSWEPTSRQWKKLPKWLNRGGGAGIDEASVFFIDHPFVQAEMSVLEKRIASALSRGSNQEATDVQNELRSLQSTTGSRTIVRTGKGGQREELRFRVNKDGIVEVLEIWKGNVLTKAVTNQVVDRLVPIPENVDTTQYEKYKNYTVENEGLIGLRVVAKEGKLFVTDIAPGSPAAKAGIISGSEIRSVNDKPINSATAEEFMTLAKGTPSVKIMAAAPDGEVKEYHVEKVLRLDLPTERIKP